MNGRIARKISISWLMTMILLQSFLVWFGLFRFAGYTPTTVNFAHLLIALAGLITTVPVIGLFFYKCRRKTSPFELQRAGI